MQFFLLLPKIHQLIAAKFQTFATLVLQCNGCMWSPLICYLIRYQIIKKQSCYVTPSQLSQSPRARCEMKPSYKEKLATVVCLQTVDAAKTSSCVSHHQYSLLPPFKHHRHSDPTTHNKQLTRGEKHPETDGRIISQHTTS